MPAAGTNASRKTESPQTESLTTEACHGKPAAAADQPGLASRLVAARLLGAVVDARTPLDALTDNEHGNARYLALSPRDRALVRAILAAALRHRNTIEALIAARLDRPLPANAHALSHVLHVAATQMLFLDVPDSAAVDLAVAHAKSDPRTARFAGLVNAVLREIGRRKERALPAALAATVDAPQWFSAHARSRLRARRCCRHPCHAQAGGAGGFFRPLRSRGMGRTAGRHRAAGRHGAGGTARRADRRASGL